MKTYKPIDTFPSGIKAVFSNAEDGSIAAGGGKPSLPEHEQNADRILQHYFDTTDRTKIFVTYLPENTYTHVVRVTKDNANQPIKCDALYTTDRNRLITLPVADCVATVVYDPVAGMLGVLHLGRHASVAGLIEEFAIAAADTVGSDPRDWHVWMSPSLRPDNDVMDYFEPPHMEEWQNFMRVRDDGKIHIDIAEHNRDRFERLGVEQAHIYVSPINTYTDKRYYSHRAATELAQADRQGRMMVAAMMA